MNILRKTGNFNLGWRPVRFPDSAAAIRLLLAAAVLAVFWPLTDHGFINFDDPDYITENPHVLSGLTLNGLRWAFTTFTSGNWHPLTWLSHMMDVEIFGLNPGGHHLTGLILHLLNTLLLNGLLRKMTGKPWQSGLVAALFAFHPLHVESVAWAAERKDLLCGLFWMLTISAYARFAAKPSLLRYLTVLAFFSLGLMAKPMIVTLPFVLLLLDVWPLKRFAPAARHGERQASVTAFRFAEKVPLLLLSGISCTVTVLAQQAAGAIGPLGVFTLRHRLGNALVSYSAYLFKTFWPARLGVLYPHPGLHPAWKVIGAFALLALLSSILLSASRKRPYLGVGWLWYLGTLVPVIGLVQVGVQAMADRYTYLPLIGIFIILAWGGDELFRRRQIGNGMRLLTAACVVAALVATTRRQLGLWQDQIALYAHTVEITENNAVILNNLGLAYADSGPIDKAVGCYREAIRIEPNFENAHVNLGNALMAKGRPAEAASVFRKVIRSNAGYPKAHFNLAVALTRLGKPRQAAQSYRTALMLDPNWPDALNNLGNLLLDLGRLDEAVDCYRESVRIDPMNAKSFYNMAVALQRKKDIPGAIEKYRKALQVDPGLPQAHINLGNILLQQDKFRDAAGHYHAATMNDPANAQAHFNMGVVLMKVGRMKEAAVYFRRAVRIEPDFVRGHVHLAVALERAGRPEAANLHIQQALRIDPDNADAKRVLEKIR